MKRKRILIAVVMSTLAAILIAAGLNRVYRVYQHYRTDMLAYESRHLGSIVATSASGLDWMLRGYDGQLGMLMDRWEFTAAESQYIQTGDPAVMQRLMSRPDVRRLDMRYCVAVYESDKLLAATEGGFPTAAAADESLGSLCSVRVDENGEYWFVFTRDSDGGIRYELAVQVQTLFAYQAKGARVGRSGFLFLMDRDGRFISYSGQDQVATVSVDTLVAYSRGIDRETLLSIADKDYPEAGYQVFRFPWGNGAAEETLVVASSLGAGAEALCVGASMSFSEFDSFLSDTLHEVAWIILLEIGGALILLLMAGWVMVMNRRSALELAVVSERADLLEEINRQQQSLYHTERLQQLGVMTSGIVHEFNNMLTPIMGQSMLLLEELADRDESPEFEYALDVFEASEKAREMLKRMSVLGKKDVDMGFVPLELNALMRKTMNLASMAKDPHLQQVLRLAEEPVWVIGNEQLLTQAFLNLCINAFQAMGSSGTLTLTMVCEMRSGRPYAVVEVADTGPGIPVDAMKTLYDPFFTTKGEKGTGLGLSICKKIIETHKGTIVAGNRETGGAVFTVSIPATDAPAED